MVCLRPPALIPRETIDTWAASSGVMGRNVCRLGGGGGGEGGMANDGGAWSLFRGVGTVCLGFL